MGVFVGLDVGDVRVGLSISDNEKKVAVPLAVIEREYNSYGFNKIKKLLKDRDVEAFVVGLPVRSNGEVGTQGQKVLQYIESLKDYFKCSVIPWDERYTTVIADRAISQMYKKKIIKKGTYDSIAAQQILQSYLDHLHYHTT
jgi:putative Holliday junction resolvase